MKLHRRAAAAAGRSSPAGRRGSILLLLLLSAVFAAGQDTDAAAGAGAGAGPDGGAGGEEEQRTGTIIGIDLGTTYSCVGVFQNGRVEIITNDQGNRITPSYVAFAENDGGERLVGDAAKNQATVNPENTIFDVKRLIGRRYDEPSVQSDKKLMPYKIVDVDGRPYVQIKQGGEVLKFAPEEISAMILSKLRLESEKFLGRPVNRAVVTVPAYFNDAQRHATRDAGIIAGMDVERIINEPTAAAIAYGMDKLAEQGESNILVFDLGGGTFDVTVLSIDSGIFQVLATNGDTHLGGSDFDQKVMSYYLEIIHQKSGGKVDVSNDKRALQKLRKEVERVKRALSSQYQARLDVEDLVPGFDFSETLTRAKFEELNADLFRKTLGPVKQVMEDAELDLDEIDEIILVGGSTRIPKVQQLVSEYFNGKQPNAGVHPDEAVAQGAAIQGSILSGEGGAHVKDVMLLDVAPLSLGTSIEGGLMSVLIKRGTTIPTERSSEFVTVKNNQAKMTIDVFEGERSMVKDNHLLGEFTLTDIPPGPRGAVKVLVTYKIDANGILEVTAENKATKNVKKITITPESGRLSQDDIDRMVREAEQYAEEDQRASQRVEARNRLESFAYSLQSTLSDNEESLTGGAALKELMDAIDETLDWLDRNQDADKEDFDSKYSELNSISSPIMSQMYSSGTSGEGGEGGEGGGAGFDGDDEL